MVDKYQLMLELSINFVSPDINQVIYCPSCFASIFCLQYWLLGQSQNTFYVIVNNKSTSCSSRRTGSKVINRGCVWVLLVFHVYLEDELLLYIQVWQVHIEILTHKLRLGIFFWNLSTVSIHWWLLRTLTSRSDPVWSSVSHVTVVCRYSCMS